MASSITSIVGLQNLPNLQSFYADWNSLTTVNLSGLSNLVSIDISDSEILGTNDPSLTSVNLTGCTALEQIRLDDNDFSAGIPNLTGLTNLTHLDLDQCNISGSIDLSNLTSLTTLDLSGNNNLTSVILPSSPLNSVNIYDSSLTELAINNILVTLDASGVTDGYVDLTGANSSFPTGSGVTARDILKNNKGWTVNVNEAPPASVNISASTDFDIVGDFTIEMFISVSNLNGFPRPYSFGAYPAPNAISIEGGTLYFWGNNGILVNGNFGPNVGGWDHIAIVGEGSSVKIYTNGSLLATNSYSGSIPSQGLPLTIGYGNEANSSLNGYMNNFRWSNVARYTGSSYTVPQAPFTNDSSTVALLFQGNNLSELLTDNSGNGHNALNAAATYSVVSPFPMLTYGSIQLGNI